ncbi:MAG: hypothetical protein ACLFSQ_06335 [Candidatus Zixiibacteriota bacterium]
MKKFKIISFTVKNKKDNKKEFLNESFDPDGSEYKSSKSHEAVHNEVQKQTIEKIGNISS